MNGGVQGKLGYIYKVILIGDANVGKTTLVETYQGNGFDKGYSPTIAPAYTAITARRDDGTSVTLHVWDTAGSERYQSVSQLFFRSANVALVCFASDDHNSMIKVPEWVRSVKESAPECSIILVMTKADLITETQIHEMSAEIEELRQSIHATNFVATSSLTQKGLDELFKAASSIIIDPTLVVDQNLDNNDQKKCSC